MSAAANNQLFSAVATAAQAHALRPQIDAMLSADSRRLFDAWRQWRGNRLLPRRRDMDLVSISRLMPRLAVIDVQGPEQASFRLAGTEIEEKYGRRLTGRSYIKMVPAEQQRRRGELLWRMATQPCAGLQYAAYDWQSGERRELELFGLPMLPDRDGEPVQVLAVVNHLPSRRWGAVDNVVGINCRSLHFIDIGAGIPVL